MSASPFPRNSKRQLCDRPAVVVMLKAMRTRAMLAEELRPATEFWLWSPLLICDCRPRQSTTLICRNAERCWCSNYLEVGVGEKLFGAAGGAAAGKAIGRSRTQTMACAQAGSSRCKQARTANAVLREELHFKKKKNKGTEFAT